MDAIEYYSSIAPSYEALYKEEQVEKIKRIISLVPHNKNSKVLDIGAGTGLLEENLKECKITALEPSEMADFLEAKKLSNVKILRLKASKFKSEERFDLVFCITVLQDLDKEERKRCIKAALKYCKHGGRTVISVLEASKIDLGYLKPILTEKIANDIVYVLG